MKVLVTGATGLLGSHIVHELIKKKYQVRVLVREKSNREALTGLKVEYVVGQLTRRQDINRAVAGCRYVIHSAARAIHIPTRLDAFKEVNYESTRFIAEACQREGVERLVYVSTANCFPNGTLNNPGTETGKFPSWLKRSGYAFSKYLAQQLVLDFVKKRNLNAVIVNPTFIIGRDLKPDGGKIFSYILNKNIAFHPAGGKNFVHAGAAATGVVNALELGRTGECYLLAGENLTYRQFFRIVTAWTKRRTILIPIPCSLLKLSGRIGDFLEQVLKFPVQLTYVNARMLCLKNYYSPDKAIKELALPVVPAKDSIEAALHWFSENKRLK